LSKETIDKPFEFVITYESELNNISRHDYTKFKERINRNQGELACDFRNLENDATLVIPLPEKNATGKELDYRHLTSFIQNAPITTQQTLWKAVAQQLETNLENNKSC